MRMKKNLCYLCALLTKSKSPNEMNRIFSGVLGLVFVLTLTLPASARHYRFRVTLTDKASTAFSLAQPEAYLSGDALTRRRRQSLPVDSTDLPVSADYVKALSQLDARPVVQSKWNNTVVMESADSLWTDRLQALPFVKAVRLVWIEPDSIAPRNAHRKKEVTNHIDKYTSRYGASEAQIALHHGDSLHAAGYRGQGMRIAVIDAGFYNADCIKMLKDIRLLGTRDFVNPSSDIFAEQSHGMMVLSCMAAHTDRVLVGSAPEASYLLLRSEDNDSEQLIEEDYWAAALEYADSVGVDVVNTSLGYYAFDDARMDHRYRDLDGFTSLMSASASRAADKGMVVVCSAGNAGRDTWKKITPPGDADAVLTIGAVDRDRMNAIFSSVGPTQDGRVKPDLMAIGVSAAVCGTDGCVSHSNGTSFASPILCGLVACFWQACPQLTAHQVIKAMRRAGDRADYPDTIFGYGIPDVWKAFLSEKEKL
jgi:subtilisin family serine protease